MTHTVTEQASEFNIYDVFDILSEHAVPRPGLDEEGRNFIENLPSIASSPSWKMVVGFLNRHVFIDASGEHTLRLSFYVEDEHNTKNPTRPFVLTQSSNTIDLVKWAKRAGNRRMSHEAIAAEMNQRFGGQIRLEAKREHHNVSSLIDIIEEGRILNFDNLCRYISVVAPNVRFEILAMQSSKLHRTVISKAFRMEWRVDFTGEVKVFFAGRMTPYTFTDDEDDATGETATGHLHYETPKEVVLQDRKSVV